VVDLPPDAGSAPDEQPLELILARNLVSIVTLPALLIDVEGRMVFYNEAAAEVLGQRFEESGSVTRERWLAEVGPVDERGRPVPSEELPLTIAIREGHPAYGRFWIRSVAGVVEIEVGALPLVGPAGHHGAMVVFWPLDPKEAA
jgi:PAS domain-containing protein